MANAVDGDQKEILRKRGSILELDECALGSILLADRVKDKPVVVVSVAGAFRKGKSFLLNFFLRYLRYLGRVEGDWMGDPEASLRGFGWSNGSEPHTTGIRVWSEVFLVTTSRGEELAVVLMDTQGTFDCETTPSVYSAIFALSTMVSSVLIYNVSQNIQEDDLQHLQLFADYGQLALEKEVTQPFQRLLFLVRDWAYPYQACYGAEGGQKILEERLRITKQQDKELRLLRQRILSCFSSIGCFLLPYPGTKVATSEFFDGHLSDIDEEFKRQLRQLVRLVLAPDNLLVKEVDGRKITCFELMAYFKAYVRAFKKGSVLQPCSLYQATLKASNTAAKDRARDFYIIQMLEAWNSQDSGDPETMKRHHHRLLEEAKRFFEAIPKLGGQEYSRRYMDKLTKEIQQLYHDFCKAVGKKKHIVDTVAFNATHALITTGIASAAVTLAVVELPVIAVVCGAVGAVSLTTYVYNTVRTYRRKHRQLEDGSEALLSTNAEDSDSSLVEREGPVVQLSSEPQTTGSAHMEPTPVAEPRLATASATSEWEALAEAGNHAALVRAKQMYNVNMEQLCDEASPSLSPLLLKGHHYRTRKTAQELFSSTCRDAGLSVLPHFMERLSKEIDELFENFVNQNRAK